MRRLILAGLIIAHLLGGGAAGQTFLHHEKGLVALATVEVIRQKGASPINGIVIGCAPISDDRDLPWVEQGPMTLVVGILAGPRLKPASAGWMRLQRDGKRDVTVPLMVVEDTTVNGQRRVHLEVTGPDAERAFGALAEATSVEVGVVDREQEDFTSALVKVDTRTMVTAIRLCASPKVGPF